MTPAAMLACRHHSRHVQRSFLAGMLPRAVSHAAMRSLRRCGRARGHSMAAASVETNLMEPQSSTERSSGDLSGTAVASSIRRRRPRQTQQQAPARMPPTPFSEQVVAPGTPAALNMTDGSPKLRAHEASTDVWSVEASRILEEHDFAHVRSFLKRAEAAGVVLNRAIVRELARGCREARMWDVAQALSLSSAVPPDHQVFHQAIRACGSEHLASEAMDLLRGGLKARGLSLTKETYTEAIIALGHCKEQDKATSLAREMHHAGFLPNIRAVSALATTCATADAWTAAVGVLEESLLQAKRREKVYAGPAGASIPGPVTDASVYECTLESCLKASHLINNKLEWRLLWRLGNAMHHLAMGAERLAAVQLSSAAWVAVADVCSRTGMVREVAGGVRRVWVRATAAAGDAVRGTPEEVGEVLLAQVQACQKAGDWSVIHTLLDDVRRGVTHGQGDWARAVLDGPMVCWLGQCAVEGHMPVAQKAVRLLEAWSGGQLDGKSVTLEGCASFVRAMVRIAGVSELERVLKQIEWKGDVTASAACCLALEQLAKAYLLEMAVDLLHEMRRLGLQRTPEAMAALIKACAAQGKGMQALALLQEMPRRDGLLPNKMCYEAALPVVTDKTACSDATTVVARLKNSDPVRFFERMRQDGLSPDEDMYATALKSLADGAKWERALELLSDLTDQGVAVSATAYTYAIDACANAGGWEMAVLLLERMDLRGVEPTVYTYTAAIKGCGKAGQWKHAQRLLDTMIKRGVRPNVITYIGLLDAYAKARRWQEAVEVLRRMPEQGVRPHVAHHVAVMDAQINSGAYREALAWYEKMKSEGVGINPYAVATVMRAWNCLGEWEKVVELYFSVDTVTGLPPSRVIGHVVINSLASCGQWPVAAYMYDTMIKGPFRSRFNQATLNCLVVALEAKGPVMEPIIRSIYRESYEAGLVTHWSRQYPGIVDLHMFSRAMAKAAIRHVLAERVRRTKAHSRSDDLLIVTGHGKQRGKSLTRGAYIVKSEIRDFLSNEITPSLFVMDVPDNPGRLFVNGMDVQRYVDAQRLSEPCL